ncbi:hypothetical protein ABIC73_004407 [Prescottella equi]|uniref:hypothetical protein n=1 Tax=Rhodococcus hoagii TaxID=43767 RepID=UPI003398E7A1
MTVFAVLVLWGGTQLAIARGQDVAWYTGFGQWIGALGSLIAAAVALGIATTDRRHAADLRKAEQADRDADLAREAGLVRVEIKKVADNLSGADVKVLTVKNRRQSRLFEVDVICFETYGAEPQSGVGTILVRDNPDPVEEVSKLRLVDTPMRPGAMLEIRSANGAPPVYGSIHYTDEAGRRWEVDSKRKIARKVPWD